MARKGSWKDYKDLLILFGGWDKKKAFNFLQRLYLKQFDLTPETYADNIKKLVREGTLDNKGLQ